MEYIFEIPSYVYNSKEIRTFLQSPMRRIPKRIVLLIILNLIFKSIQNIVRTNTPSCIPHIPNLIQNSTDFTCIYPHFQLIKTIKGLTRLASHNSNMVAPHKQNYEGGWTIYGTKKSHMVEKQYKRKSLSFFYTVSDNSSKHGLFLASSTTDSTSTSTKTSHADIVKSISFTNKTHQ